MSKICKIVETVVGFVLILLIGLVFFASWYVN